jgi:pyridoxine/pyridoxamine 5'-phosphate oxidase
MTRIDLLRFLRAQPWAVEASVNAEGKPQAAVKGVAATGKLELVFDTLTVSRKAANLRGNRRIALVMGWDDGQTAQIEGLVRPTHRRRTSAVEGCLPPSLPRWA